VAGYVLDTSAIMAVLYREEGRQQVTDLFQELGPIHVPFMALMEVRYKLIRERPQSVESLMSLVDEWPVQVVESDPEWRYVAALVKSAGGLSLGDSWMASLALLRDATLVHKDPEFEKVESLQHLPLPYKARRK
jgi:predicted nucleic acid-binding protein